MRQMENDMININNYEQYFLLYTDGELSLEEEQMVDVFVLLHPELGVELEELLSTRLSPVSTAHEGFDASFLKKSEQDSSITIGSLINLLDGELAEGEAKDLLEKINADRFLSEEWASLKKARLDAEPIVFAYKDLMYKQPAAVRPSYYRWRVAAAAIFLGLMLLAGAKYFFSQDDDSSAIVNVDVKNDDDRSLNEQENVPAEETKNTELLAEGNTGSSRFPVTKQEGDLGEKSLAKSKEQQRKSATGQKQETIVATRQDVKKENEILVQQINLQQQKPQVEIKALDKKIVAAADINTEMKVKKNSNQEIIDVDINRSFAEPSASFAAIKTDDNETSILYMKASMLRDTKLGMAFSKVKKAVRKKTRTGDEGNFNLQPIQINL